MSTDVVKSCLSSLQKHEDFSKILAPLTFPICEMAECNAILKSGTHPGIHPRKLWLGVKGGPYMDLKLSWGDSISNWKRLRSR